MTPAELGSGEHDVKSNRSALDNDRSGKKSVKANHNRSSCTYCKAKNKCITTLTWVAHLRDVENAEIRRLGRLKPWPRTGRGICGRAREMEPTCWRADRRRGLSGSGPRAGSVRWICPGSSDATARGRHRRCQTRRRSAASRRGMRQRRASWALWPPHQAAPDSSAIHNAVSLTWQW